LALDNGSLIGAEHRAPDGLPWLPSYVQAPDGPIMRGYFDADAYAHLLQQSSSPQEQAFGKALADGQASPEQFAAQAVFDRSQFQRLQSGQDIASLNPAVAADRNFFGWLADRGLLPAEPAPGLFQIAKDAATGLAKGALEWAENIGAVQGTIGGMPDAAEVTRAKDATNRAVAEEGEGLNLVRASYQYMTAKTVQLLARHDSRDERTASGGFLTADDPVVQSRARQTLLAADLTHYQRVIEIGNKTQEVSDQLQKAAVAAGASPEAFRGAGMVASIFSDPMTYILPEAGKAIGAALSAGERPLLGIAEGYRMKVAALSAQQAELTKQVATFAEAGSEYAAERLPQLQEEHAAITGELQQAQAGFNHANASVQSWIDRYAPSVSSRLGGGFLKGVARPLERTGSFFDSLNESTAPARQQLSSIVPKVASGMAAKLVPTGLAGAAVGYLAGDGDEKDAAKGFLYGAVAPELMMKAGAITRSLGETVALGEATLPFWTRFSHSLEANGLTKASKLAQLADPFATAATDAGLFGKSFAVGKRVAYGAATTAADFVGGAVKGAVPAAALGYYAGGDANSAEGAAATAVGAHFGVPFALIGGVSNAFEPTYSPGKLASMRVGNLSTLKARWQMDPASLERLNSLPPGQQLDIAAFAAGSPDFALLLLNHPADQAKVQVALAGSPEKAPDLATTPGLRFTDPSSGRSAIAINPDADTWLAPVVAHEAAHEIIRRGGEDAVVRQVIGDPALGVPGIATQFGPDGEPVKNPDGSYALHPDFQAAKADYEKRMLRVTGVPTTLTPEAMALEYAAEAGADHILGHSMGAPIVDTTALARPAIGDFVRDLAGGNDFVRNILGKFGVGFQPSGDVVRGSMNLEGAAGRPGLTHAPEIDNLVSKYAREFLQGQSEPMPADEPVGTVVGKQAVLNNPSLLQSLFPASSEIAWQPNGLPAGVEIRNGRPVVVDESKIWKSAQQIAKDQTDMVAAIGEAVKSAKDVASDPKAVQPVAQENGQAVLAGRYFSPETLAALERSGKFNPVQMANLTNLSNWIKSNPGGFSKMLYQPASKGSRYASLRAGWRSEVPYAIRVTKADNVVVQTLAYDNAVASLRKMWAKDPERMARLWENQISTVKDLNTYLTNLSEGKHGTEGIGDAKRDVLNLATGISTTGRADVNPLYDFSAKKIPSIIRTRRIDRINRLTSDERPEAFPWSPEAYRRAKVNYTPGDGPSATGVMVEASAEGAVQPDALAPGSPGSPGTPADGDQANGKMGPGEREDIGLRVSTRVPTAKKATEDALASQLSITGKHERSALTPSET
jgi:hypothetical protein